MRCADRADIDDHAAFTLCKILPAFLTHSVHEAKGVDAERLMEHFIRQIGNGGVVVHDTGVVDGNVQLSKRLDCLFDHAYSCFRVADVARIPGHFAGCVLAFLCQLFEPFLAAGDRHDLRALAAEQLRRGAPDPGGSAGHDADFTI